MRRVLVRMNMCDTHTHTHMLPVHSLTHTHTTHTHAVSLPPSLPPPPPLRRAGCDIYVDVHGDEEIPANFFASTAGVPNWDKRLAYLFAAFSQAFVSASPDFQVRDRRTGEVGGWKWGVEVGRC